MSASSTNRNTWPYTTPSGHTYEQPTTYQEFLTLHDTAAQATIEGWDEPEHPPQPTWDILRPVHARIGTLMSRCERLTDIINEPDPPPDWRPRDVALYVISMGLAILVYRWVT